MTKRDAGRHNDRDPAAAESERELFETAAKIADAGLGKIGQAVKELGPKFDLPLMSPSYRELVADLWTQHEDAERALRESLEVREDAPGFVLAPDYQLEAIRDVAGGVDDLRAVLTESLAHQERSSRSLVSVAELLQSQGETTARAERANRRIAIVALVIALIATLGTIVQVGISIWEALRT